MKKFKRFLCIPLLVLFTMTLLTLPVAAAVTVLLPDGKPAASMTFTLKANLMTSNGVKVPNFGPVSVTTNAQGIFAYPAELLPYIDAKNASSGFLVLSTTSPSMMRGMSEFISKDPHYNTPLKVELSLPLPVKVLLPDRKPAASMTFTLIASGLKTSNGDSVPNFGPVSVTTDAQGFFAYPAELLPYIDAKNASSGFLVLSTTSPSKMRGASDFISDTYNEPLRIELRPF